jgi:hypothetical protein
MIDNIQLILCSICFHCHGYFQCKYCFDHSLLDTIMVIGLLELCILLQSGIDPVIMYSCLCTEFWLHKGSELIMAN